MASSTEECLSGFSLTAPVDHKRRGAEQAGEPPQLHDVGVREAQVRRIVRAGADRRAGVLGHRGLALLVIRQAEEPEEPFREGAAKY